MLVDAIDPPRGHDHDAEDDRGGRSGEPPVRAGPAEQAGPPAGDEALVGREVVGPHRPRRSVRAAGRARRRVTGRSRRSSSSPGPPPPARPSSRSDVAEAILAPGPARGDHLGRLAPGLPRARHRHGQGDRGRPSARSPSRPRPRRPGRAVQRRGLRAARSRGPGRDGRGSMASAILAGGTGLYLRAVARGLDTDALPSDPAVRARLEAELAADGPATARRAPERAGAATRRDGRPREPAPRRPGARDRRARRRRRHARRAARLSGTGRLARADRRTRRRTASWIAGRARAQFDAGLIEEARALRERFDPGLPAFSAIGYREAWAVLDGALDRDAAIDLGRPAQCRVRQAPADLVPFGARHRLARCDAGTPAGRGAR